jgi:hypothetical protein
MILRIMEVLLSGGFLFFRTFLQLGIRNVPVADPKIQLIDEIMLPKSECDTVHEFIAYVVVEKTSA